MFRLIRMIFLVAAAFVAGVLYERNTLRTTCLDGGGVWEAGTCYGLKHNG